MVRHAKVDGCLAHVIPRAFPAPSPLGICASLWKDKELCAYVSLRVPLTFPLLLVSEQGRMRGATCRPHYSLGLLCPPLNIHGFCPLRDLYLNQAPSLDDLLLNTTRDSHNTACGAPGVTRP
ncbi:hypothetical protein RRG08_043955 [Elysia crispata]|uniref:Uncharacterized protein n=1 Tax=Elysia crispata TaxID=231223 RepID=A0AAE0Y1P2_9GAST|nr:hypothetical protein RRG08_043955 [Elysia crispata]